MRRMAIAGLGWLLLLVGLTAQAGSPGTPFAARLVRHDQLIQAVHELRGKVVLVAFWAEYCAPCQEELKKLLVLNRKYGPDGLALVTVSLDDPSDQEARARVNAFLTQQQADCPSFLLDAGWPEWQRKLAIAGPPCLYVFNRDNHVVHKHTQETDPGVIEAEVAQLLQRESPDSKSPAAPIDFHVTVHPADPFSDENQVGQPRTFRRGEVLTVVVHGRPREGIHTYPMTQRTARQSPSALSRWQASETPSLRPLWPITESKPEFKRERTGDVLLELDRPFTWSRDILILPEARAGKTVLSFSVQLTTCDQASCTPGNHPFEIPIRIRDDRALPLSAELQQRLAAPAPGEAVVAVPAQLVPDNVDGTTSSLPALPPTGGPAEGSLLGLVLTTMGAALAMLFTPCVLPMVPITVSFFLKQSPREQRRGWLTALVYSGTIIVVLALAVLILGKIIVDLASSPWMNLALGLVLVLFALSLLGMYELELPGFLSRYTAARERKEGYLGAVFMALTFTITSFTCTGPFLGPLLVTTREMQLSMSRLVLAAFVYSATFAGPFFLLALFPALLKRLPRSGGWLNAVKVVMGFLELGAALKLLTNTDAALHPGSPWLFTFDTVVCAWIALSVACGLYLFGLYRLPHDSPVENIGVARLVLATGFIGLGLYMVPLLWGRTPQGVVGRFLAAFAPLNAAAPGHAAAGGEKLDWYLDYDKARARALAENKLLFIDFTGVSCQNCRANEVGVFSQPGVQDRLRSFVCVQLYTDSVPRPGLSAEEARREAQRNSTRESETFAQISTPLYVIFQPDRKQSEDNGKLLGVERGRSAGYIQDVPAFVDLLKRGQNNEMAERE